MKHIDLIYTKYLNDDLSKTIGGVQTYITDLSKVLSSMGAKVRLVQFAGHHFIHQLEDGLTVVGYHARNTNCQALYDYAVSSQEDETLTIFATDTIIPNKVYTKSLAIQHGIFWDIPQSKYRMLLRHVLGRAYSAYKTAKRLSRVSGVVCVDYNFQNWYRTQVPKISGHMSVIPNYTKIPSCTSKPENEINLIFARRFYAYRGTRVFTEAITKILEEGYNINVTIAGSGPDEEWMKERLEGFKQVQFIQYDSAESLRIHKDKHIAVVPTVGSEGTSLSLLEAMASQCAVICTDVGGMTNIVINRHNGLMVPAGDADCLYDAIKVMITDNELRECLANAGFQTVKEAFSYERWTEHWRILVGEYLSDTPL